MAWIEYDAPLEPLPWGRNVYTILRVDPRLVEAAAAEGTHRVEGRIDDVEVNLALNRADVVPDHFLYAGKPLQRRLGARPGDVVRCRLRPVDPDLVPLDDDVREALEDARRLTAFERLRPAQRRQLLVPVDGAATDETRRRRIDALVSDLAPD
ncbi:MAG: YdeI/OmpD-associated family protein [Candidatus Nanopelagicales bacterium]